MLIILVDLEDVAETPDDENSQAKKFSWYSRSKDIVRLCMIHETFVWTPLPGVDDFKFSTVSLDQ